MSPKFVKNFKIVRLTENLPVWKRGVYDAEMYDDGTVIIHNPSKNYPTRSYSSYSIHKSWFGETWAYHYEPEDQDQDEKEDAPVKNLEDLIVHLDRKGIFNAHEDADKAVALLTSAIEKHKNFAVAVNYTDFMKGTEQIVAKVLRDRGFCAALVSDTKTGNPAITVSAVARG